jgi:hypothetical protein
MDVCLFVFFFCQKGHYHYDTTPDIIQYEAFLVPAENLFRIGVPGHRPDRTEFFGAKK